MGNCTILWFVVEQMYHAMESSPVVQVRQSCTQVEFLESLSYLPPLPDHNVSKIYPIYKFFKLCYLTNCGKCYCTFTVKDVIVI